MTKITYGDGTSLSYEYSDQNLRTGQVSRNGCRTLWKYDDHGRQVWEARPDRYELHQE